MKLNMGKMGGSRHLKTETAPKFWPIPRKKIHWAAKPSPGPHPIDQCIPLLIIVRDILGYAKTRREAKQIISKGKILVDGKVRRDDLFPAGLMDVISIPETDENFRILPSKKGLILHPISKEEAEFKLCRIENKTTVRGGDIQLNLHDGRNILIRVSDPQNPIEDSYKVLDTLKIKLDDQSILNHVRIDVNVIAILTGGKNIGRYGKIISIEETGWKRRKSLTVIEDDAGSRYQTILDYVFAVGSEEPLISLPKLEETGNV